MIGLEYLLIGMLLYLIAVCITGGLIGLAGKWKNRDDETLYMFMVFLPIVNLIYCMYLLLNIHKMINFTNLKQKLKV